MLPINLDGQATNGALVTGDGLYRYRLWRIWDDLAPIMVWILLNPSTADAFTDDPTLRKCVGFAKTHRHGGVILVNLYAWRATNPKDLSNKAITSAPIGPENDTHILWACKAPLLATVVGGWGANRFARDRARAVRLLVAGGAGRPLHHFGRTAGGEPKHPLYLPYSTPLEAA